MRKTGNFSLNDIQTKMGGMDQKNQNSNPFDIFLPSKEYFLANEVRSVDLSDEERQLLNL